MLEDKTSEAGFREQFKLEYLRKKGEERKAEVERKEERQRVVSKHKENVAAIGDRSAELQAYVQQHFDQQRTLLNHQGQKEHCDWGCSKINNNQHVLS